MIEKPSSQNYGASYIFNPFSSLDDTTNARIAITISILVHTSEFGLVYP